MLTNPLRTRFSHLVLSTFLLGGASCATDQTSQQPTSPGTLTQQSSSVVEDATPCDANTLCGDGLECLYLDVPSLDDALCLDSSSACDLLDCGDEECLILESYPAQVTCSQSTSGSDDDDCSVDSDGNTDCPGDDDGSSPGGSSPGNPGPAYCDAIEPCDAGTCMILEDAPTPVCGDLDAVCEDLGCTGECLILESYPVQVRCSE